LFQKTAKKFFISFLITAVIPKQATEKKKRKEKKKGKERKRSVPFALSVALLVKRRFLRP